MIACKLKRRGTDDWGSGDFQASRIKSDGTRKPHKGIDYACEPGTEILSPCVGKVTKLGYPYAPVVSSLIYRYVEVTDLSDLRHRVFYLRPTVELHQQVTILTVIGFAQDISSKFHDPKKQPMIGHIHYEVLAEDGSPLNPEDFHNG